MKSGMLQSVYSTRQKRACAHRRVDEQPNNKGAVAILEIHDKGVAYF